MSRDDVKKMIDEVDENKDGRLDYGEVIHQLYTHSIQKF
jgi:Ca2+-binding EF-hand superfamily protein